MALRLYGDGNIENVTSINTAISSTELGYLDGLTSALQGQIDTKLDLAGGKILQIVRATDTSIRSTTSTSFTDFGLSVTITPQSNTNAILLIFSGGFARSFATSGNFGGDVIITDSSNNAISGAQRSGFGYLSNFSYSGTGQVAFHSIVIAYATPATTSATTYKVRYKSASASATFQFLNDQQTAQLFALEVSS